MASCEWWFNHYVLLDAQRDEVARQTGALHDYIHHTRVDLNWRKFNMNNYPQCWRYQAISIISTTISAIRIETETMYRSCFHSTYQLSSAVGRISCELPFSATYPRMSVLSCHKESMSTPLLVDHNSISARNIGSVYSFAVS